MTSNIKKIRVLYVDDELNVLRSYQRALRGEDFEISFAQSGAEALDLIRKMPTFQVLVTDFRMPGMNGIELIREAKKALPQLECAILSGFADEATIQNALAQSTIRYFWLKPIGNDQLRQNLRELVSRVGSMV